jgi:predicted nucleic acid-binding protein
VTIAVHAEILRGIQDPYAFLRAVEAHISPLQPGGWLRLTDLEGDEERERYAKLAALVHSGEAASLAIAAHRGWTFVTDDRAARQLAQRERVAVTGTLGILLLLIDQDVLNLARPTVCSAS